MLLNLLQIRMWRSYSFLFIVQWERGERSDGETREIILSTNHVVSFNLHINPGSTVPILKVEKMELRLT